jgi:hypothetical protein
LLLLINFSCSNSPKEINKDSIPNSVQSEIKSYFENKLKKTFDLKVNETDSILELFFTSKINTDEILGNNIIITIPKMNKSDNDGTNSIVYGDLNSDNLNDLVISVYSEGENGSAILPDPSKIFVFLNSNNGYFLGDITDSDFLNGNEPGFYSLVEIKDSKLYGRSRLWGKDDSESNPTKIYNSIATFQDNKLVFESKKFFKNGKKS